MKCEKTDPLLYLSARVGVLSAALPSWEELMRRPEREEAAPERQDALPLREDAQTGALLESLARGAGRPLLLIRRWLRCIRAFFCRNCICASETLICSPMAFVENRFCQYFTILSDHTF